MCLLLIKQLFSIVRSKDNVWQKIQLLYPTKTASQQHKVKKNYKVQTS